MSTYLSDALAREHQAIMLADAAANRAAHRAGELRRANRAASSQRRGARGLRRPLVAVQHWIASGML